MYKVKICGICEAKHLRAAVESGASYVGFVFFEKSRRNISIQMARSLVTGVPPEVVSVALMVDPSNEFICRVLENVPIDMLQLHGHETTNRLREIKNLTNLPIMKAIGVKSRDDLAIIEEYAIVADQLLLDAKPPKGAKVPGGLGNKFDWRILADFKCEIPWMLAGGLTSENIKTAIEQTTAFQFDVSSGVEDKFGTKSEKKIFEFLNTLKGDFDE